MNLCRVTEELNAYEIQQSQLPEDGDNTSQLHTRMLDILEKEDFISDILVESLMNDPHSNHLEAIFKDSFPSFLEGTITAIDKQALGQTVFSMVHDYLERLASKD